MRKNVATIDAYIDEFPRDVQTKLEQMRVTIRKAAPKTEEAIKYGIPTFMLDGKNLVFFAGYKHHIGFYPGAGGIAEFKKELAGFKFAKGSVQFPLDEPLPLALVTRITRARVRACAAAKAAKAAKVAKAKTKARKKASTRARASR